MTAATLWVVAPASPVDESCCSPGERAWAASLGAGAERHLRSRAVVRHATGTALGVDPREIPLVAPPGQPPRLDLPAGPAVSLAHAAGVIVVALSDRAVGVDVEVAAARRRPVPAPVLTPQRRDAVAGLVPDPLGALAVWVVLEAALKAAGTGFGFPHRRACLAPTDGGVHVTLPGIGVYGTALTVDGGDGVLVAVATPDVVPRVRCCAPPALTPLR